MAKTASTGFTFRKSLIGVEAPVSQSYILEDSVTVKIGDLVRIDTSGYLKRCAAGEAPLGVLVGITDQNRMNVFSPRAQGTTGATLTPDDQVATSSTNTSDGTRKLRGEVIIDPAGLYLFYNDADSDLSQAQLFMMFDATNGNQITGSGGDANGQMQLMALDPDGDGDASKGLFRISENQFGIGLDSATAKNAA